MKVKKERACWTVLKSDFKVLLLIQTNEKHTHIFYIEKINKIKKTLMISESNNKLFVINLRCSLVGTSWIFWERCSGKRSCWMEPRRPEIDCCPEPKLFITGKKYMIKYAHHKWQGCRPVTETELQNLRKKV